MCGTSLLISSAKSSVLANASWSYKTIMSDYRLHSRYDFAYLASLPTEVVIVSSIIIQCRRPVATDEPGGVVAIGEGLMKGIGKKRLVARKQDAALKTRVNNSYPSPQLLPY